MSADNRFNEALPEELKAVETVLRRLTPNAQGVDRDRMMYLAGRASVTSRQNSFRMVWPISTAALLLISSVLGARVAEFRLQPAANRRSREYYRRSQRNRWRLAGEQRPGKQFGNERSLAIELSAASQRGTDWRRRFAPFAARQRAKARCCRHDSQHAAGHSKLRRITHSLKE